MATVVVTFFKPAEYEGFGVIGEVRTSESLTSSGTSGQTTITSLAGEIASRDVYGRSYAIDG